MSWISKVHGRQFVCYLHFIGLENLSLGIHINWLCPNIELHLPFCFIKIGWAVVYGRSADGGPYRSFGKTHKIRREE